MAQPVVTTRPPVQVMSSSDASSSVVVAGAAESPRRGPGRWFRDENPLDPAAAVENKYYAEGVGLLVTVQVTGPAERSELVAIERF
jgi:hypothetical protein